MLLHSPMTISPTLELGRALVGGLALAAVAAAAACNAAPVDPGGDTAGLAVLVAPAYAGSDEYRGRLLPQFDLRWRNGVFLSASEGLGYRLHAGDIAYGVQVTVDRGRRERDAEALRGLGDVNARPEFGVFAQAPIGDAASVSASLRHGSGNDRRGLVLKLSAVLSLALSPDWAMQAGLAATLANAHHQQAYFGVMPAQSTISGLSVFRPTTGLQEIAAIGGFGFRVGDRDQLSFGVAVVSLQGDARRSPLVRRRTAPAATLAWNHTL